MCVCVRVSVPRLKRACVQMNRSSILPCFWKSEGRCCSIGRLCMTLMNTLIGPHEDRPDRDRLICIYCALWLDERRHGDGCLPLWQGLSVFAEMCYLMKCSSKPVDRNILKGEQMMSSTVYHMRHLYYDKYISIWAFFAVFWLLNKLPLLKFQP